MQAYNTIRKSEKMIAQVFLVFLGIALHSLLVVSLVLGLLNGADLSIVSSQFLIIYSIVMIGYSGITSLYVVPTMVISPYYIQVGTLGVMLFVTIYHIIAGSIDPLTLPQPLVILFLIFAVFLLGGFGLGKFLRWILGMSIEPNNIWLKTYRIDVEYMLLKKIFEDVRFSTYKIKEVTPNKVLKLTRKFGSGIKILLLLHTDPKSPTESILSISSCEIKFETIWKTDEAYNVLISIKDQITGALMNNYSRELIEDTDEKYVSSKCELFLSESFYSPLSKLGDIPRKSIFSMVGLLVIAFIVTLASTVPSIQEKIQLDTNTIVLTWLTIISTILLLNSAGIKTTIQKIQKH